jgi:hypothetical protein
MIEAFERRTSITIGSVADLPAAHALAGHQDEAVAELERPLERRDSPIPLIGVDPAFDLLHAPRPNPRSLWGGPLASYLCG